MTESDKVEKHVFSEVTKPAEEDASPMPQRGSTQCTVISGSFALVRDEPASKTTDPHSSVQARDVCDGKVTSRGCDWADNHSPQPTTPVATRKRQRIHSPPSPEVNYEDGAWPQVKRVGDSGVQPLTPKPSPRYLVVESDTPGKPLSKCNMFAISKWFLGVSQSLQGRVSKSGSGFLVDCPSARVSWLMMRRDGSEFISLKIKVSEHRSLNSSKGVIWCPDLEGLEEAEILENLVDEGVSKVERCMRKKGGIKVPTHTLFLTFSRPTLPESITISCYLRCKVSLFVPKPLQCFTCYKFGHPSSKCKKKDNPLCGRCGHGIHEGTCPHAAFCSNCKGAHAPTSRQCPTYKKEALIKKIMSQRKIPFKEAKLEAEKEIEGSVPQKGKSYASAATAGTRAPAPNPSAPTTRNFDGIEMESQIGKGLPKAIRAEALALARNLGGTFRNRKESTSTQVEAPNTTGAKQAPKPNKKNQGSATQTQAKPGKATAPAPQAAEAKQASKPDKEPAPKTTKAGNNKGLAPTHQAARSQKVTPSSDPTSAPQAAGSEKEVTPAKQAAKPVSSSSKAKPGETPTPAPQAVGMKQALETPLPTSDNESEMEVASASTPQASEVQVSQTSPNSLKNGVSFATAAKEGTQNKARTKIDRPKEAYNFEFKLANQRAKKKSWSRKPRPNGDGPVVQNKYTPLGWNLSEDPEEMDANVSFPSDWN